LEFVFMYKAYTVSGRLKSDPEKTRYGCFLPDLTELARRLSTSTFLYTVYPY